MKKSIIFLAAVFTLFSCVRPAYTPEYLTLKGQNMFASWLCSMTGYATSYALPAQLFQEYQTLETDEQRQEFMDKYFPCRTEYGVTYCKIIVQEGNKWVVIDGYGYYDTPILEVEYVADTAYITTFSQSGTTTSKLIKNGENFDFQLIAGQRIELSLKMDNLFNVLEGGSFYYDYETKIEFEIKKPLFYSTEKTIIDGEIDIKVTNIDGKTETVNVIFEENSVVVTFRGVTERMSYKKMLSSYFLYD